MADSGRDFVLTSDLQTESDGEFDQQHNSSDEDDDTAEQNAFPCSPMWKLIFVKFLFLLFLIFLNYNKKKTIKFYRKNTNFILIYF